MKDCILEFQILRDGMVSFSTFLFSFSKVAPYKILQKEAFQQRCLRDSLPSNNVSMDGAEDLKGYILR